MPVNLMKYNIFSVCSVVKFLQYLSNAPEAGMKKW
jgi:hypothetical protein